MKSILEEITRLRFERNWSEYDLSKHAGLSQSTISTWYRKKQVPTIQTLYHLPLNKDKCWIVGLR